MTMIRGNMRLNQLNVPMLMRIEITFTMIATHQAHERILQSPIATARVIIPSRSNRTPRIPTNAPSGPAPAAPAIAPRAMSPSPPTISASPARNDRIAIIATPIGRFGAMGAPYIPGGAMGGGIVPAGAAIDNLWAASGQHYINIPDKIARPEVRRREFGPACLFGVRGFAPR